MAGRAAPRALREEDIRALAESPTATSTLPTLLLLSDDPEWRALAYLLRVRSGGFCIVSPAVAEVADALAALVAEDESPLAVVTDCRIELETPRRRPLGEVAATLADISWAGLSGFRRPGGVRLSRGVVAGFAVDGTAGRPVAASALAALDAWVSAADDDDPVQEYVTAEEDDPGAEAGSTAVAEEIRFLRERVAGLEQLLDLQAASRPRVPEPGEQPARPMRARDLFSQEPGGLSSAEWERLRNLVGPAPSRLGRIETGTGTAAAGRPGADELAAAGAGAENLDENLEELMASSSDPLQKILAVQTSLLKSLLPKPQDSISAALQDGSDNGGVSSGSGVKGHQAREAFLKQLENHTEVARIIRVNACQELGVPAANCPPGLMRDYLEKRMADGNLWAGS